MGSTIYDKDLSALEQHAPFGNGECAGLIQALTDIGHTSKWRPGLRVMDLVYLQPGTVIANFKFREGFLRCYPNQHGYHVSFFMGFSPRRSTTGEPLGIVVMDQWRSRKVGARMINAYTEDSATRRRILPCDNANEFYVVMK